MTYVEQLNSKEWQNKRIEILNRDKHKCTGFAIIILSMDNNQIKPYINFSLGIKLGIAETSLKNKSIAE